MFTRYKEVTWYKRHGTENSGIIDATPNQVSFHHPFTRFGKGIMNFLCMDGNLGEHKERQNGQVTERHKVSEWTTAPDY